MSLRIAREIHDDAIQSLVLVAHNLECAAQSATVSDAELTTHLKNARSQLITTIDNLRQTIADLRSTVLDELGLVSAIESLCEEQLSLEFRITGSEYWIEPVQALAIFRTAQEAIRNAVRHAHAKQISATLVFSATSIPVYRA